MRQAPPDLREFARGLLGREAGDSPGPEALAEAAAGVIRKLYDHLARVVGPAGFDALLLRALGMAGREHACLNTVRVHPGGILEGHRELSHRCDPREAEAGLVLALANVYWLLVTFIGEDLVSRLVGELWPASAPDLGAPAAEVQEGKE